MKKTTIEIEDKLGNVPFFIDHFHEKIHKTDPHKHDDYYELIFLSRGEGFHWIETEEYGITAPEFYYLKPGQLHHWQFTAVPKGFIIMFKASYFDQVRECNVMNLCMQLENRFRIDVPLEYSPDAFFQLMFHEFHTPTEFSATIIHGVLVSLIAKMLQLAQQQSDEKVIPITLFDKFLNLVVHECAQNHLLQDYASLLNTTTQSINAACKKHSEKAACEHITAHLMLEAKRYILHTDNTMSEITHLLSFSDASYFGRFFKSHEGITPLQFRAKYIE